MTDIDDRSMSGIAAGDGAEPRLDELAARYHGRLNRFFRRRLRSAEDAADMTQEMFTRLAATDLRRVSQFGPFLYRMAVNLLHDRSRSVAARMAERSSPLDEHAMASEAPLQERILSAKQELAILERALAELPERRRIVFVLCRFDHWTHQRIADELGISVSMVEKHVHRALLHCRRRLDEARNGGAP